MIKNHKQASATRKELEKLILAKTELSSRVENIDLFKLKISEDAFNSLADDLEYQLKEYENLKEGNTTHLNNKSIEDLPSILIAARLAQNKTHKELAELLDVSEQQIQRYEANDYEGVRWETLSEVALALGLQLNFNAIGIMPNSIETCERWLSPALGY